MYITNLLDFLRKIFGDEKSVCEALSGLERNYKKTKGIKFLGNKTVQEFVDFYTFTGLKKDKILLEFRSIIGFREVKAAISVKLIEKIAQSIEN